MTRFPARFALALLVLIAFPCNSRAQQLAHPASTAQAPSLTPETFNFELRRLARRLDTTNVSTEQISAVRASLPVSWEIDSPERHYSIPSRPLASILRSAESDRAARAENLDAARNWLSDLSQQIENYSARQKTQDSAARGTAQQILARREFGGIGAPNPRDLLRRKINELIRRLFIWLFGGLGRHPIATETFFWLIVAAVVGWLAMMLFRFWAGRAKLESIEKISTVASRRPWQEWIRAAREAAARGDFREAVHSTYWAGVSRLETLGALAPDPSRTPRESLRVLGDPAANVIHATTQQRESLAALTACLERVWYGRRAAGPTDFQDCLRQAEELGCRVS
jgi:hypothetical protein